MATEAATTTLKARELGFIEIGWKRAAALNRSWHRTQPVIGAPRSMRICYGALHDGNLYAIAMWSNPVARMLPQTQWMELRRFAIHGLSPKNTASRMLGWMAHDLKARFPELERLISYQDKQSHEGTIYRASGWTPHETEGGGDWSNRKRWNRTAARRDVVRWEKELSQPR